MRRAVALALAGALLIGLGCNRQEADPPPEAPNSGQWTGTPTGAGGPSPMLGQAAGFPCAQDTDAQCPFARCIQGRCGGCSSTGDCKPNGSCAWTPLGLACVPGGSAPGVTPQSAPGTGPSPFHPMQPAQPTYPGPSFQPGPQPAPPVPWQGADRFAAARRVCFDKTNELRARAGVAPLALRPEQHPCTDQQAAADAQLRRSHASFGRCGEAAQNECPGWGQSPESTASGCLEMMYAEGPGGGHHRNIVNPRYGAVACGFSAAADGKIWMVHDMYQR